MGFFKNFKGQRPPHPPIYVYIYIIYIYYIYNIYIYNIYIYDIYIHVQINIALCTELACIMCGLASV